VDYVVCAYYSVGMNNANATPTIQKTSDGRRWQVLGVAAAYGSSDSSMSPVIPPTFKTRRAAEEFARRAYYAGR
jgi:hypothetical protein